MKIKEVELLKRIAGDPKPFLVYSSLVSIMNEIIKEHEKNGKL